MTTIIAFDQSTDKTGMVIVRFDDRGAVKRLYSVTAKTPTAQEMTGLIKTAEIKNIFGLPDLIACEDGFFSTNAPKAGEKAWTTRGWIEGICACVFPGVPVKAWKAARAEGWRKQVWGNEYENASAANCKAHAILFGRAHGLDNPTDHEGEALAIAFMGWYSLGGINLGKVDVKG